MSFRDIIGHDTPTRLLRSALARNRLAHAYLFHGDEGIGKRLTARALAWTVTCETLSEDACGACTSCRWAAAGTHPDIREIAPTGKGRIIRIEFIRELQNTLALRPVHSRYKVAILDDADRLNMESANALLKTLEEPPDHSLIVLITSRPNHLLPTLLSRCIRVRFSPLSSREVRRIVSLRLGVGEEEAGRIERLAMGRMSDAMTMSPEALMERLAGWIADIRHESLSDIHVLLSAAERNATDAATAHDFLVRMAAWLRDAVLASTGNTERIVHAEAAREVADWAAAYDGGSLLALYQRTTRALALLDRNVNARLLIEDILFDLRDLRAPAFGSGRRS